MIVSVTDELRIGIVGSSNRQLVGGLSVGTVDRSIGS